MCYYFNASLFPCCQENTVLRACFPPHRVSVIPNAVDASEFEPAAQPVKVKEGDPITIIGLSRLVYRKGIDILALVIPEICMRHENVKFIIGEAWVSYFLLSIFS